jgi:dipeptidyl aminopeptidase/acylaminoacyl peptidase
MEYDPAPVAKKVKQPVLILQGSTDMQVLAPQADSLAKLIRSGGNKDVTVKMFPATNHLFIPDSVGNPAAYNSLKSNKIRPEVVGTAADWLAQKLGVKPIK